MEEGGRTLARHLLTAGFDSAPLYRGLPDDMCPCEHWCYLARGELRFPIHGDLMGGLFVDAGNLWLDTAAFDPTRLRPATGFGLRYATPVGPVALDLGVNLDRDELLNEDPVALHFSIGLF